MMTDDERGDSTRDSQFSPLSGRRLLIQLKVAARVTSTTVVMPPLERCGYSVKRCSDPHLPLQRQDHHTRANHGNANPLAHGRAFGQEQVGENRNQYQTEFVHRCNF